MSTRLQVEFAGLRLEHPIVAASAGTTKDAEHCFRAQEAGFSAVILKSVQEEMVNRYNPLSRFALVKSGIPGYNAVSFFCYEQAFEGDIHDYAEVIRQTRRRLSIPVIASINCIEQESWAKVRGDGRAGGSRRRGDGAFLPLRGVRAEGRGVPAHRFGRPGRSQGQDRRSGGNQDDPAAVHPGACAVALERDGVDWLTMFTRSAGLHIDIETMSPIMHRCACGHGGPWAAAANLRWIACTYPHLRIPISATGGATGWEEVIRYLLAGAVTVQIASLIYMKGYDVVRTMLQSKETASSQSGSEGAGA